MATVKAFAESGASVALVDVKKENIDEIAADIIKAGGKALVVACDVSDESQVSAMIQQVVKEFGSIDMTYNNAGVIGHFTSAAYFSRKEWEIGLFLSIWVVSGIVCNKKFAKC